jgi:hypothetical protein
VEEADDAYVVLTDGCEPKFEVMELLLVRWHTAKLAGRWALVLAGKTSGYIGRVVAEHESTLVLVQPDGSRHRLARTPDLKIGVIVGTRMP